MKNGKTIWITGASSGIGEACAYLWAKEKANLILTATPRGAANRGTRSVHPPGGTVRGAALRPVRLSGH